MRSERTEEQRELALKLLVRLLDEAMWSSDDDLAGFVLDAWLTAGTVLGQLDELEAKP